MEHQHCQTYPMLGNTIYCTHKWGAFKESGALVTRSGGQKVSVSNVTNWLGPSLNAHPHFTPIPHICPLSLCTCPKLLLGDGPPSPWRSLRSNLQGVFKQAQTSSSTAL